MKIQHTNISEHKNGIYTVDMLIADDPLPDEGQEKYHLVCQIQTDKGLLSFQGLQRLTLDRAQEVINEQIQALRSVLNQFS